MSYKKISFTLPKIRPSPKFFNINKGHNGYSESSLEVLGKKEVFTKIKKKLRNMKKYYPNVYFSSNSIIEEWGQNSFYSVKPEILELDPKSNSLFWV